MQKRLLPLACALSLFTAVPAAAQSPGVYLGLQGGASQLDFSQSRAFDYQLSYNADAYIGYAFTDWIGIEVGAGTFGEFEDDESDADLTATVNQARFGVASWASLAEHFAVYAKLNLHYLDWELEVTRHPDQNNVDNPVVVPRTVSGTDAALSYQFGFMVPLGDHFAITQNNQYMATQLDGEDASIISVSLGVQVNF